MYTPTALRPYFRCTSAMRVPASSSAAFQETASQRLPYRRCGSRRRSGSSCTSGIAAALGQMWPRLKGSSVSPRTPRTEPSFLQRALDDSLRRLGVDCVDLYQVHSWDPITPLEETLGTLDDFVRAGKVRYTGLSNYTGWQVQKTVALAKERGWASPVTLQPQYNLLVRELEWEIVPSCLDAGLGLLPWSPLGGGWLTGKYRQDERPTGDTRLGDDPKRGVEAYDRRSTVQRTWDVVDAVRGVAEARGVTMAQVALAWLVDRPAVTSVILGARTTEQLADNLGAAGLHLDEAETAALDAASDPGVGDYPYGDMGLHQRGRTIDPADWLAAAPK